MQMNSVNLIGRLTRDIELRYTPNGKAVCNVGLAINQKKKKGDEWLDAPIFIELVIWGKTGEKCAEILSKGSLIGVTGKLDYQQWEEGDKKRSKIEVVADSVVFLDPKKESE